MWLVVVLAALVGGLVLVLRPSRRRSAGDLSLERLGEGVYLYRGYFSNSAVFVLDDGVVVVDTQVSPRAAARLRREIERVTDKPIKVVINTHYHGDHSGGNAVFPEADIVMSEETSRYVVERDAERVEYAETFGLEFDAVHPTVGPTRTFAGATRIDVGGDHVIVEHIGRAETPDAVVVTWPARRAVAVGDGVATFDYPFLGVPFMDEGLRDDGEWIRFLSRLVADRPALLLPGHGPAIVGEAPIRRRLELLIRLFSDLLREVRAELLRGTPPREVADRVAPRLAHYPRRRDLREHTVGQRFAIHRCTNNLCPDRKGKGWWHDLRPSVVTRAPAAEAQAELAKTPPDEVVARAKALARDRREALARTLLELHLERSPADAAALGLYADLCFLASAKVMPKVDATEYVVLATKAAKRALAIDPDEPLALLNLGASRVFGGVVLAQPMDAALAMLERALASGRLDAGQRARARFFIGRAHQAEERLGEADQSYRQLLPRWGRWMYPLIRARVMALL